MVRSFQDVRLFQRLSLPAERDDGRAGAAGREPRHACSSGRGRVKPQRGRDPEKAMDWLGFVGMAGVRQHPRRRAVVRPVEARLAGPGAGHRGRRAAARRAGVGHRHQVGRHDARPGRGGARAGPYGLHRGAQPARGRPPGRPHLLHGAGPDHRPGHDRRARRTRRDWRRPTLELPDLATPGGAERPDGARPSSSSRSSAPATAASRWCSTSTSTSTRARSSASSATTAAARAPRSRPILGILPAQGGKVTFQGHDVTKRRLARQRQGGHGA